MMGEQRVRKAERVLEPWGSTCSSRSACISTILVVLVPMCTLPHMPQQQSEIPIRLPAGGKPNPFDRFVDPYHLSDIVTNISLIMQRYMT